MYTVMKKFKNTHCVSNHRICQKNVKNSLLWRSKNVHNGWQVCKACTIDSLWERLRVKACRHVCSPVLRSKYNLHCTRPLSCWKKNIALSTFIAFGSSNEYFCWEPFLYSFKWSPDALVAGECIAAITTVHTVHSAWGEGFWNIVDPQPPSRSPTTVSCVWVEPPAFGGGGDMSGEAAGEKERKKSKCWAEQDHVPAFLDRWKSMKDWVLGGFELNSSRR